MARSLVKRGFGHLRNSVASRTLPYLPQCLHDAPIEQTPPIAYTYALPPGLCQNRGVKFHAEPKTDLPSSHLTKAPNLPLTKGSTHSKRVSWKVHRNYHTSKGIGMGKHKARKVGGATSTGPLVTKVDIELGKERFEAQYGGCDPIHVDDRIQEAPRSEDWKEWQTLPSRHDHRYDILRDMGRLERHVGNVIELPRLGPNSPGDASSLVVPVLLTNHLVQVVQGIWANLGRKRFVTGPIGSGTSMASFLLASIVYANEGVLSYMARDTAHNGNDDRAPSHLPLTKWTQLDKERIGPPVPRPWWIPFWESLRYLNGDILSRYKMDRKVEVGLTVLDVVDIRLCGLLEFEWEKPPKKHTKGIDELRKKMAAYFRDIGHMVDLMRRLFEAPLDSRPALAVFDAYGEFWRTRHPTPNTFSSFYWDHGDYIMEDFVTGVGDHALSAVYCGPALFPKNSPRSKDKFYQMQPLKNGREWEVFLEEVALKRVSVPVLMALFQSERKATSKLLYEFLRGNPGETIRLLQYFERNAIFRAESKLNPCNLDTLRRRCQDWMLERVQDLREKLFYLDPRLEDVGVASIESFETFLEFLFAFAPTRDNPYVSPHLRYDDLIMPKELIYKLPRGPLQSASWPAEQALWELFQVAKAQKEPLRKDLFDTL